MGSLKTRFTKEIGTRVWLRRYWTSTPCSGNGGNYHNAMAKVKDFPGLMNGKDASGEKTYHRYGGEVEDYDLELWPAKCDKCGALCPETAERQVFNERLYDTESGKLEPGCLYYAPWYDDIYWDNQVTPTLVAICPNGEQWVIDGRASNCGSPNDKLHRCWCRHGDPEREPVTVDKIGNTCSAGGGSIQAGNYHGFLRNGYFVD